MPVEEVSPGRYRWGNHGKVYRSRAAAERQGRAAYAAGYRGDALIQRAKHLKASPRAETRYVLDVMRILGAVHAAALHIVHRELRPSDLGANTPSIRHDVASYVRTDAGIPGARRRLGVLWEQMAPWVRNKVHAAFGRMSTEVRTSSADGSKLLGIRVAAVPGLERVIGDARDENVSLISNASRVFLDQVRDTLEDYEGQTPDKLAGALEDRVGVSSSRAQLIARDQTLKLNASVTRTRHEAAGVTRYRWSTSNDERVRPRHKELNGKTFAYDDPPDTGDGDTNNPGEDFQCRCVAIPLIPGLDDDASEDNDDA